MIFIIVVIIVQHSVKILIQLPTKKSCHAFFRQKVKINWVEVSTDGFKWFFHFYVHFNFSSMLQIKAHFVQEESTKTSPNFKQFKPHVGCTSTPTL